MTRLCLGVVDVAYTDGDKSTTTGDVAEMLEENFRVMGVFYELHKDEIEGWLVDAISGDIESLSQGKPPTIASKLLGTNLDGRPLSGLSINGKIEQEFRDYLDSREWSSVFGTLARADSGVTARKKNQKPGANPARAEFVDSGLYQAAFRAWIE